MRAWLVAIALLLSPAIASAHDKFPMPTGDYRKRIDQKVARYRERLEARMKEHATPGKKRDAARKALAVLAQELGKLVEKYGADATITRAEADTIKERGKQGRDDIYKDLGFGRAKGE